MTNSHYKSIAYLILISLCITQSVYLFIKFYEFSWENIDDLLTLTLVDQENIDDLITALSSGVNAFPPLYFLSAYLLVSILNFPNEILLWAHIPFLWISVVLTYKLFRSFTNWKIASFSTVSIATLKSAFLTQSIYVRPYCLYYCASLATTLAAINFQKKQSKLNFLLYWTAFQVITHTHYYGLPIGMLVSLPLLFTDLSNKKKWMAFIVTLTPTCFSYAYFLPKQLNYLFFAGTTGKTNFINIVSYYQALSFSAILVFGVFLFLSFCDKEKISPKKNVPISLVLLGTSPLIIITSLSFFSTEGTYFRYFIPAQVGIVGIAIWAVTLIRPLTISKNSSLWLLVISFLLLVTWSIRNFSNKELSFEKNYPGSLEFDHSKINDSRIPFFTSHLETFLKIIHRTDWPMNSYLLRTDGDDFIELPKFNKMLTPSSKKDLAKLEQFIYHYYYSGPHSNIDFNPKVWAKENGYSIMEINHYPVVLRFTRI